MTKITTDFVGNETTAVTKQRLTDILAYWGASTAAYTTWGQARTALNALLTSTTAGTIGSTELAGSFLPKINFLNDPDDMIADALFGAGEQGVWLDPSDVANVAWRRNLFLYSEQFNNAYWTKIANGTGVGPTVTANAGTAPDGTVTADRIQASISSGSTSAADFALVRVGVAVSGETVGSVATRHRYSVYLKSNTGSDQRVTLGYDSPAAAIVTVTSTWTRFDIFPIVSGGTAVCDIGVRGLAGAGAPNQPIDILAWGAQLEQSTTATEYQRITDLNTEVIARFPNATMYQDAAGTTPVYAPGQPVGLRLDKSKGLVLGSELVTNGAFATNVTNWTATASGILSWDPSGAAKVVRNGSNDFGILQTVSGLQAGATYRLSGSVTGDVTGIYYKINGVQSGFTAGKLTNTILFVAPATSITLEVIAYGGYTDGQFGLFDNISVKALTGNHATQSTLASRPLYGIEPKGGRRNLLTYSQAFDDASWTKGGTLGVTLGSASEIAPDGTATATVISASSAFQYLRRTIAVAGNIVASIAIKKTSGATYFPGISVESGGVFRSVTLNTNTGVATPRDTESVPAGEFGVVDNGTFWRVWIRSSGVNIFYIYPSVNTTGGAVWTGGTGSQTVWGAQLEAGTAPTNYQRVTTAFDVTEAGVNSCHYCQYDGSDDGMITNSIDFTATDKMSVFAGVRKLSDAAVGVVVELSAALDANSGSFVIAAPANNGLGNYFWGSKGSTAFVGATTGSSFVSPIANIVTGTSDISGDLATIRVNGTQAAQTTGDQGTGNFGNYPLYLGRRGGSGLPFNGRDYGILVVGKAATSVQISTTEMWLANKTAGVTI